MVKQLFEANDIFQKNYAICRKTSEGLTNLAHQNDKISILEGIKVSSPKAPAKLQSIFQSKDADPIGIDLLVHNAGAYGPPQDFPLSKVLYSSQNLETVDMETMMFAFQLILWNCYLSPKPCYQISKLLVRMFPGSSLFHRRWATYLTAQVVSMHITHQRLPSI